MRKVFLVAWREFRQKVTSRGFIIGSLVVPVVLFVIWGFTGVITGNGERQQDPLVELGEAGQEETRIGYVDRASLIRSVPDPVPAGAFRSFPDEEAAIAALERGDIAAYYIVPEDYRQTGDIQRVSLELPAAPPDTRWFNWILVSNLFPETDTALLSRLYWPFDASGPQFVSLEEEGQDTSGGFSMAPFLVTIAVMIPLFTSGGYLLQSVTQEKSNRVMEILLVSLRPWHILAGKLVGLGALTLVQYLFWGVTAGLALAVTGQSLSNLLGGISLSAAELILIVPYALGGYLLYAGIMAGVGALAPDIEGSRSWVFIISLPMMIPIYLWTAIASAPDGLIAVALSMVPFSAPVAMLMRMTTTAVPEWQLLASLALLLLTGIGVVWLMARLFRVQTLLSGESISLKRIFDALQG